MKQIKSFSFISSIKRQLQNVQVLPNVSLFITGSAGKFVTVAPPKMRFFLEK